MAGSSRTWEQNALGAALWCGPGAVLFRRSAAALWNIDGSHRGIIELISSRTPEGLNGFRVHRRPGLDVEDVTMKGPYPVTTLPRTIVDLGSIYDSRRTEEYLDAALRLRPDLLPEVTDCFERLACRGRNGIAVVRKVLVERDPTLGVPDSNLETGFAQMARDFSLPPYKSQHHVVRPSGKDAYIDFAYPLRMVAIETDSKRHHSGMIDFESDNERQAELVALGWRVLRFSSRQIRRQPEWVANQIRAALEIADPGRVDARK
jgi:very-short-patch-repair endonuclease